MPDTASPPTPPTSPVPPAPPASSASAPDAAALAEKKAREKFRRQLKYAKFQEGVIYALFGVLFAALLTPLVQRFLS